MQAGGAIFFDGATGNSNLYVANSQFAGNQVAFDATGRTKNGLGGPLSPRHSSVTMLTPLPGNAFALTVTGQDSQGRRIPENLFIPTEGAHASL